MNKVFKTKWSTALQQYVVTDEKKATRTKSSKSVLALAVASVLALGAGVANAAYVEKGYVATNKSDFSDAKASWESDEYKSDWGLTAMNASSAYALGFHGQGVKVGVMDSGALLQKHPDLAGDRFTGTHVSGHYGSDGNRYPQEVASGGQGKPYEKGEAFDVTGQWMQGVNDSHGTHVTGTVGGNRDGNVFHGVAWGSDIVVGNTGATDNNNYGPFQDYDYFYAGWKAIVDDLNASNGADRGGVINNSWGTNIRVYALQKSYKNEKGEINWRTEKREDGKIWYKKAGEELNPEWSTDPDKEGSYRWGLDHIPTNSVQQAEYEYFYFNQTYENKYKGTDHEGKSFVDAAWDAVKGTKVVQIFTTGNRDSANPFYRPLYPYFNPEAEQNWIAVSGLTKDGETAEGKTKYKLWDTVNEAGLAKWWTVVAPGTNISSSIVNEDGTPGYSDTYRGTSMAAPHVAGAMGVLMSRYQDMDAIQVRDVMFTTATHTNPDGTTMKGWEKTEDGEVSDRMGWGLPDLEKGMYGPGQFLGKFDYNMAKTSLDVWTNKISEVALAQRKAEDEKWLKDYETNLAKDDYVLGEDWVIADGTEDETDHYINKEDAKKWRQQYYEKRRAAIEAKIKNNEYVGSLIKRGEGTLIMTGQNSYTGGTTVNEGSLYGFTNSFGSGDVVVNGGMFGVIGHYNDDFTKKGEIKYEDNGTKANVVVEKGGTYVISAGEDVNVGNLTLKEGSTVIVGSADTSKLIGLYDGTSSELKGSVTADKLEGKPVVGTDLAFFTSKIDGSTDNKISATITKKEGGMAASLAQFSKDGAAIGAAIEGNIKSEIFKDFIGATTSQAQRTVDSLGSDLMSVTQNLTLVNTLSLTSAVKDMASGSGTAKTAELSNGVELWATGIGSWSNQDASGSVNLDSDFYAGLIGAQMQVCSATKLGVFFGAGKTDFKGGVNGKVESDDIHAGIYGKTSVSEVAVNYGFTYTWQDRDVNRTLTFSSDTATNTVSSDSDLMQVFAEIAYTGFATDSYSVQPYVGLSWFHTKTNDFSETVGKHTFTTKFDNQDVEVTTLGVRGEIPFKLASADMSVKADLNWMHFFGDTEGTTSMKLGDAGVASLTGEELDNLVGVGLGIESKLGESASLGISYTGAFGSDFTSNGVSANFTYKF